jgi:hypothetical protein
MINYNWLSLLGNYKEENGSIIFEGKEITNEDNSIDHKIGNLIFNKYFSEGIIKTEVEFGDIGEGTGCDIVFYYKNTETKYEMATVGINRTKYSMFELKSYRNGKWEFHKFTGDGEALQLNQKYKIEMKYEGNIVKLKVNEIEVLEGKLPFSTSLSQVGIWSRSKSRIKIHSFEVENISPKVFVIMQFTEQFNELYTDVIKCTCENYKLEVVRADNIYNNNMIVDDITRNINESKIIVADISPKNPNVYYEVGYSHALNKPTILLAEEGTELPFDVRPYRVIFYKNSISGKRLVEESLKKHLEQIL